MLEANGCGLFYAVQCPVRNIKCILIGMVPWPKLEECDLVCTSSFLRYERMDSTWNIMNSCLLS